MYHSSSQEDFGSDASRRPGSVLSFPPNQNAVLAFPLWPTSFERGLFEFGTIEFRSGLAEGEKRAFGREWQDTARPTVGLRAKIFLTRGVAHAFI
jgi:hypothetical protein